MEKSNVMREFQRSRDEMRCWRCLDLLQVLAYSFCMADCLYRNGFHDPMGLLVQEIQAYYLAWWLASPEAFWLSASVWFNVYSRGG